MRLWPRTLVKWREPRDLRRIADHANAAAQRRRASRGVLASLIPVGLVLVALASAVASRRNHVSGESLALSILVGLGYLGCLFAVSLALSRLGARLPSEIRVMDASVIRVSGLWEPYAYKEMQDIGVITESGGPQAARMLAVSMKDGRSALFGIASDVDLAALEAALRSAGAPLRPRAEVAEAASP